MRIFLLEVKRILKSRRTMILLAVALVMSVLMAYLPIAFESIYRPEENGAFVELDGMDAIKYKRTLYPTMYGEVTPEKLKVALETYQGYVREYGPIESEDFPLDINVEKIVPIEPLLKVLKEAYADPLTGIAADLMVIDPEDVEMFYEKCADHLDDIMNLEQKAYPSAGQQAADKYSQVTTPFQVYSGYSTNAFDYIEFYILVLGILCVAIAAPAFSNEYQTGSDSILRCTKHGRTRLAVTKILASCAIFIVTFIIGLVLHLLISDLAFGTITLKTSFQMLFSVISLPNWSLLQIQIILAVAGLLSVLASVSCTLFLSAKCKDSLSAMLISLVIVLLPFFTYTALGANWFSCILPSAGIGMKNNFLYQLIDFNYLHIGQMSFWTPYIILLFTVVEIPVFLILAVHSYCKHQVA